MSIEGRTFPESWFTSQAREPDTTSALIGKAEIENVKVGGTERMPGAIEAINKRIDQQAERIAMLVGISSESVGRIIGVDETGDDLGPQPAPETEIAAVNGSIDTVERLLDRLERNVRRLDTL